MGVEVTMERYQVQFKNGETKYAEAWDGVDLVEFLGGPEAIKRDIEQVLVWDKDALRPKSRWTSTAVVANPELFLARTPPRWVIENEVEEV